jgi:hypothetical protein
MVRNNHSKDNRKKLDELLRTDELLVKQDCLAKVLAYARFMANIENSIVVVSDMADGKSHIVAGGFVHNLELGDYQQENSIWESRILSLMSADEQEEKYLAEFRFFHYLRHLPNKQRADYYLVSKLRFRFADGGIHDVLHRMYYIFDEEKENVRFAICIYSPMAFDFNGKSYVVNSVTGLKEELTVSGNGTILSSRESQVLSLIDSGLKSADIANRLNISIHTVSRHRQEIIGKLQVKNTHEACRIAKALGLL